MAHRGLGSVFRCRHCSSEMPPLLSFSRAFSNTPQRARTIPRFSPSSSIELDELFTTFRTKIFTPEALSKFHRDLIYKPSRHKILLGDPGVTVTMSDDEEINLQPLEMRRRPNKKESLQRLLDLMQDRRDWNNFPVFLEGMNLAREKLPAGYMARFVRRANERGQTEIITRCAQRVAKTGVCLADPEVMHELMLGIHCAAAKCGFEGEQYAKAVHQAQLVAFLLERREHCGRKPLRPGHEDMRKNITVIAILLELRAAQNSSHPSSTITTTTTTTQGWTALDTVPKMAAKILTLWPRQDFTVPEDDTCETRIRLEKWLPVWAGIKLALKTKEVQDSGLRPALVNARNALAKSIERARGIVEAASLGRSRRCLHMYNDLRDL